MSELGLSHTHTPDNSVDHTPHPSGRPLLAVISRLTEQKGLPLIVHGIKIAIQKGAQVRCCAMQCTHRICIEKGTQVGGCIVPCVHTGVT